MFKAEGNDISHNQKQMMFQFEEEDENETKNMNPIAQKRFS